MPPAYDTTFFPDFRGQLYQRGRVFRTFRSEEDTAGDQVQNLGGSNILWTYRLGWRVLTAAQQSALLVARQIMAGTWGGLYFLEWPLTAAADLLIGEGTGADDLPLDLHCRLDGDSAATAGLIVKADGVPLTLGVDYVVTTDTGNNYVQHGVTIDVGANLNGVQFTASWDAARRRRTVRLREAASLKVSDRPNDSGLYVAQADMIETEADT